MMRALTEQTAYAAGQVVYKEVRLPNEAVITRKIEPPAPTTPADGAMIGRLVAAILRQPART